MSRTRYKIIEGDSSPYFLTSSTVNWLPLFNDPSVAQFILESLRFLQSKERITIYAYVLMEHHIHLIASAIDLSNQIANFKSFTARKSIDYYKEHKNQSVLQKLACYKKTYRSDRIYQFWQEGYHPKRIQDESMMRQKIEYIHQNPVRRSHVDVPEQWRYSSARNYAGLEGLLDVCMEW
jgi:REP element-mobilizing transposase RayT